VNFEVTSVIVGGPPVENYPQVNFEDPPVGPQEEDDASPFEEENPEIIFSGFFSPQKGHRSFFPPSLTFWNLSKTFSHFRHRYS